MSLVWLNAFRFGKEYSATSEEGKKRMAAFSENLKTIKELKKKGKAVEINALADQTKEEMKAVSSC